MLSENEFRLIVIILIFAIVLVIVELIINKTINYIVGTIVFLISMWIISLILNNLGFTALADILDGIISFPSKFFEYLKDYIS